MSDNPTRTHDILRIGLGPEAAGLATAMYTRLFTELAELSDTDWETPTVCVPWTVADITRHLLGAAKGHASLREQIRQASYGLRHKGSYQGNAMDAMNALQVEDHRSLNPAELIAALRTVAPTAVAKRMKRPRMLHRLPVPTSPGGSTAPGTPADLTLGHLLTVVLTRDVLLHRIDIARATGRPMQIGDPEQRLVADTVGEWSERHRGPFQLRLSGPAGGEYQVGTGGPMIEMDAIELCWILSGRGPATHPLLETRVFF